MTDSVPPYPPNEPWVQGWIEHKRCCRAATATDSFSISDAENERIMQDEIELQAWLKRLSHLGESQKEGFARSETITDSPLSEQGSKMSVVPLRLTTSGELSTVY
jgi:hypothetical protein